VIYTTQRHRFVYDTWDNGSRLDRVMVECTLPITHCVRLNLQLHTIDLVRTCHISSFCTVVWQLARFQLTRRIVWSLGDSWASCCKRRHSKLADSEHTSSASSLRHVTSASSRDGGDEYSSEASELDTTKNVSVLSEISYRIQNLGQHLFICLYIYLTHRTL